MIDLEFNKLYNNNKGMVTGLARKISGKKDVDDIVQDVFIHLYLSLPTACKNKNFNDWIYIVSKNKIIDIQRKEKENSEPLSTSEVEDPNSNILDIIHYKQVADLILCLLNTRSFNKSKRDAILYYFFEDMPIEQVAIKLKCGTSNARLVIRKSIRILFYKFKDTGIIKLVEPNCWHGKSFYELIA